MLYAVWGQTDVPEIVVDASGTIGSVVIAVMSPEMTSMVHNY